MEESDPMTGIFVTFVVLDQFQLKAFSLDTIDNVKIADAVQVITSARYLS